jgi:hypothetical protein
VRRIWLADPEDGKLFTYNDTGVHEVKELALPDDEITLTHANLFGAV